ncbi:hypothetical protein GCM10009412_37970 [Aeromonas salmonicida subsp. achromogenes]
MSTTRARVFFCAPQLYLSVMADWVGALRGAGFISAGKTNPAQFATSKIGLFGGVTKSNLETPK